MINPFTVSCYGCYLEKPPCYYVRQLALSPQTEFLLGKSYYSDDSFGLAAEHFEVALDEYFTADQECRALCEGAYNYDGYNYMEYSADLFQTITGERLSREDSCESGEGADPVSSCCA